MECPICYEVIGEKNNCVTECGHSFCFKCVTKALTMNNACPCCRTQLVEELEDSDESELEDSDESEYEDSDEEEEGGDHDDDSDDDDDECDEETKYCSNLLSADELKDNMGTIYEKLLSDNFTHKEMMHIITMYIYGTSRSDLYLYNATGLLTLKQMEKSMNHIVTNLKTELMENEQEKIEQQLFANEDLLYKNRVPRIDKKRKREDVNYYHL